MLTKKAVLQQSGLVTSGHGPRTPRATMPPKPSGGASANAGGAAVGKKAIKPKQSKLSASKALDLREALQNIDPTKVRFKKQLHIKCS